MTAEGWRAEAEVRVDEHRAWLEGLPADSWLARFAGSFTYGPPETPREEMIARYIQYWQGVLRD